MHDALQTSPRIVRFSVFELDSRTRELRKAGVRLALPEQPLQILESLLENHGALVTREELRQRLWPGDTFVDFEHGLNAAVKRLRDVLGDSADTPRFIETLPRRGYRFICPIEPTMRGPAPDVVSQRELPPRRTRVWLTIGSLSLIALAVGIAWWWGLAPAGRAGAPVRVVPLTSLNGWETDPTFSPDGDQVAFEWTGENGNTDIYTTIVGSPQVGRLTDDPGRDFAPSWSPDGSQIAFVRSSDAAGGPRIHVMSAVGGTALKVSDLPTYGPISWSPDSRYLAVVRAESKEDPPGLAGIYLVPTQRGEPRALTHPVTFGNLVRQRAPTFSPDGRRLAYISCPQHLACYVEVLDLDAALAPTRPARRVTQNSFNSIHRLAWTRDGATVIFDNEAGFAALHLWRVDSQARRPAERIEVAGLGARGPATASSRDRLAFARQSFDTDIYMFERGRSPAPVVRSSFTDFTPVYSRDGQHIAFCSARSGEGVEVWVAASDGSGAHQITRGPGRWQCSPHWSPDGKFIAFDSVEATGQHVWIIDADGGVPRQITSESGTQVTPTWSRDGLSIYYSWFDGKTQDIWRVRVSGGPPARITRGGAGFSGMESIDGRSLVYSPSTREGPLLEMPLMGGPPRRLAECVAANGAFHLSPQGLYYVPCHSGGDEVVHLKHTDSGRDEVVVPLGAPTGAGYHGLAVSPDGARILFTKMLSNGADLVLIEHFK